MNPLSAPSARPEWAEAAGTAVLVVIGTGAIVGGARIGGLPIAVLAPFWFAAIAVPVVLFARASGAHLNPAVTLALALSGRFDPHRVPRYVAAQVAGAFAGSLFVLGVFGGGAHLGSNVPSDGNLAVFVGGEAGFTALLVVSVFWISDRGEGPHRLHLLLPAAVVGVATYVVGPVTGCSLNPARTLAPAVLSGTYGYLSDFRLAVPFGAALVAVAWRRPVRGR